MITSVMTLLALPRNDRERRGGQCYYELGSPLWSHASSRCPTSRSPCESHTHRRDGQPRLRASRRTPGPSLARHRSCAKSPSSRLVGGDARPELMASAALSAATHRSTSRREYGVYASSRS